MTEAILIILFSLLLSAFFSGMEIAFVSSNKLRFEIEKSKKKLTSSILSVFYENQEQFITTMLVGNNIVLVVYSLKTAELLTPYLLKITTNDMLITLLQTLIATIVILFTGEFLPKTIFKSRPNLWLNIFAIPLLFFYVILYPISIFCSKTSILLLRIFRLDKGSTKGSNKLDKSDLDYLLQENIESNNDQEVEQEVKILQNALDFSNIKLRDCIVPRTEIVALEQQNTTLESLKTAFVETGYSKILIYKNSIDNIIGYIHSSEMFKKPQNWKEHLKKMPIVPETMAANKLMKLFMKEKKNIAVVVDEFGGTSGIVTLEDIIEEIFGEIEDEYDNRAYTAKKISEKQFILSGRLEIEDINSRFNIQLPESENYQTIAGFILFNYQNFPEKDEAITIDHFRFKIIKANNNRIELVELTIL